MDRRLLLAISLSVLVVIAYQEYLRIYYPQKPAGRVLESPKGPPPEGATSLEPPVIPGGVPALPSATGAPSTVPEGDVTVRTAVFEAKLATRGARLASLRLKKYRSTIDPGSPGYQLVSPGITELPLGIVLRGKEAASDADLRYEASASSLDLKKGEAGSIVFRASLPAGGEIEKRFRFAGHRYDFVTEVLVRGTDTRFAEVALAWVRDPAREEGNGSLFHGVEALVGKKIRHFAPEELEKGVIIPDTRTAVTPAGPVRWAGYADTYFLSAILAGESGDARLWVKQAPGAGPVSTELLVPVGAASTEPYPFTVFAGPKDLAILAEVGHDLTRTVDLGWFSFVAEPMLRALKFFHNLTGNYGFDIILLTILIKILFFPLTQKSFRSMRDLQRLQPELKKLQEKYKDDRQELNKEVMELYRRHKVNPLGGCLPMLLQMPIFIGLYNALLSAVELRHAPFALWINDLSAPDRLPALPNPPFAELFGYDIRIPVLTLLMGASMLVQQKLTPAAGDPMQQRMMMLMPIVFTVMFVNFPAGLVLYWLVNNVLTIAQQAWMQRPGSH